MNNRAMGGGAIEFKDGKFTCYNCSFIKNYAETNGGAVRCISAAIFNSTFDNNFADSYGGAIIANKFIECTGSNFTKNHADVDGGAILAFKKITVTSCIFDNNVADGSYLQCYGGAIRAEDITCTDSKFFRNKAHDFGGAIYAYNNVKVTNSIFKGNEVYDNDGGAIYCKDNMECRNSLFMYNVAKNWGGAIYCDDKINLYDSTFDSNQAYNKQGGAVFCDKSDIISNCTFFNNYAKEKGGAVTIWKRCTTVVEDSTFVQNIANKGGAIYTDSREHHIVIHHNIFYKNQNMAVYVTGYFKQIDHNYFGTPNPNFYEEPGIFVEWKSLGPNLKYVDTTYFKTLEDYKRYDGSVDPEDPGKHDNDSDASNVKNKSITMEPTGLPIIAILLAIFLLPIVRFKK